MGWITETSEAIKAHTRTDPIECPRGWGQVAFVSSVWCVPPLFGVDRRCPIGGVADCGACKHASNPDAFDLARQIGELDRLRSDGHLSPDEFETRRLAVVEIQSGSDARRRGMHVTAWILGPLGALILVAGIALVELVHPGFWGLAGLGAVMLALTASFWALARPTRSRDAPGSR